MTAVAPTTPVAVKPWYSSLTVWAGLATMILMAFQQTLDALGPSVAWAANIAPYITSVLAIIGRFRATTTIAK